MADAENADGKSYRSIIYTVILLKPNQSEALNSFEYVGVFFDRDEAHEAFAKITEKDRKWSIMLTGEVTEPVFILKPQDIFAPRLVRAWVEMARDAKVPEGKCQDALRIEREMIKHPGRKIPD